MIVKHVENHSQKSIQGVKLLSGKPLNHNLVGPTRINANSLHLDVPTEVIYPIIDELHMLVGVSLSIIFAQLERLLHEFWYIAFQNPNS